MLLLRPTLLAAAVVSVAEGRALTDDSSRSLTLSAPAKPPCQWTGLSPRLSLANIQPMTCGVLSAPQHP